MQYAVIGATGSRQIRLFDHGVTGQPVRENDPNVQPDLDLHQRAYDGYRVAI